MNKEDKLRIVANELSYLEEYTHMTLEKKAEVLIDLFDKLDEEDGKCPFCIERCGSSHCPYGGSDE